MGCVWATRGCSCLGDPWGKAPPAKLDKLRNWFSGKSFLPAFELGPHNIASYVQALRDADARFLVGYASACHQLCKLAENAGLSFSLEAVFPTAEMLPDAWAADIRRTTGARVLPYYGCGEVQSLGYSCPDADSPAYHVSDEHVAIEAESVTGPVLEGEGPFLVTDLDNLAMPFIRYRNGDAGLLAGPGCRCGRRWVEYCA